MTTAQQQQRPLIAPEETKADDAPSEHDPAVMEALVAMVKRFRADPALELECLLINTNIPLVLSGVGHAYFEHLLAAMKASVETKELIAVPMARHVDAFLPRSSVRARLVIGKAPVFANKTRVSRIDMVCAKRPALKLRANLKAERKVRGKISLDDTPPSRVRLVQSWIFTSGNIFEYKLAKSVTGPDKQTACTKKPAYEVEIELLRTPQAKQFLEMHTDEQVAAAFLDRAIDVMGRFRASEDGIVKDELLVVADTAAAGSSRKRKSAE